MEISPINGFSPVSEFEFGKTQSQVVPAVSSCG